MDKGAAVEIDKEKYTGCGLCVGICPGETSEIKNTKAEVDEKCVEYSI